MEKLIKRDLKNININWNNQKFTYDCLNDNLNLFLTDDNINKSFFNCKLEGFLTYFYGTCYGGQMNYTQPNFLFDIYYYNILNEMINIIYFNKKYKINDLNNINFNFNTEKNSLLDKKNIDCFYDYFDYYIQLLEYNNNDATYNLKPNNYLNVNEYLEEINERQQRHQQYNFIKEYQKLLNEQEKIDNEYTKNIKINLDKINIKNNNLNNLFYIIYFLSHYKKYNINFINTYHFLIENSHRDNYYMSEFIQYCLNKFKIYKLNDKNNILKYDNKSNNESIDNYYYCVNINKEYNEEYNMEMELIFKNYKLKIKELNKYEILYEVINNDNSKYSFKKDNIIHSNIDYFDYINEIILNYINIKEKYDEEIKYEDEYLDDYKNEDDKDENYIDIEDNNDLDINNIEEIEKDKDINKILEDIKELLINNKKENINIRNELNKMKIMNKSLIILNQDLNKDKDKLMKENNELTIEKEKINKDLLEFKEIKDKLKILLK